MKPFNLEEAKAGKPVVTRDGIPVRIICFDRVHDCPIIALWMSNGIEQLAAFYTSGESYIYNYTLFMKTEKKEGWINIYSFDMSLAVRRIGEAIYPTEEAAKRGSVFQPVATIKIEWEE